MTPGEIADRLEEFIHSRYSISAGYPAFTRDVDLYDLRYVDYVALVKLLAFIKANFEVEIENDDLLADEFANTHGVANIVSHTYAPASGDWEV